MRRAKRQMSETSGSFEIEEPEKQVVYNDGEKVSIVGLNPVAYRAGSLAGMIYSCAVIAKVKFTDNSIEEAFGISKKADKPTCTPYKVEDDRDEDQ